ncbi:MAG: LptF/LptG family permease, partial [Pseudomonadota bacterium]|nr:LptF/LptG family permease [Pseudomonadota bacterium]
MKIFSKLIGLIILKSILVTLFILVGLDSLAELIDESKMIKNNYGIINVTQYVLTKIPSSISEYFPFAVLIGCLFGLGQLSSSNEILVIRATGVSKVKIFSIVSMPIFFLLALVLVADEYLNPYLDQKAEG